MRQEKLGVVLEKEDEMECLVAGCNFFLKAIRHEAFTFENGQPNYIASNGAPDGYHSSVPPVSPKWVSQSEVRRHASYRCPRC